MKQINRIIRTLDIATSNEREDALKSIIFDILFNNDKPITFNELYELIVKDYSLKPNKNELKETIDLLSDDINYTKNRYELLNEKKQEILLLSLKHKERKLEHFKHFGNILDEITEKTIEEVKKISIIQIFIEYLYDCFLSYDKEALKMFIPNLNNGNDLFDDENLLKNALDKLSSPQEKTILKKLIAIFPQKINSDLLAYLDNLASKAESFFSLGLKKELYNEIKETVISNWTLLLDTNYFYSILDLHSHRENAICKEINQLVREGKVNIQLNFLPETFSELKNKKNYLEKVIINDSFKPNQIRALLDSDNLDPFARQYYTEKLKDNETPHPSEKIRYSNQILNSRKIELLEYDLMPLKEKEKHFEEKYSEFNTYLETINSIREEKGLPIKSKSPDLIDHDIFYREAILFMRDSNTFFSKTKLFGLTLDRVLINFDRYILKQKNVDSIVPTFFLPSMIIRRIRKILPLDTDDYKRAFISAISSSTFVENKPKSRISQRTVSHFKKIGIDNEELILNCLVDDLFLNEFENRENTDTLDEFVESEINKRLQQISIEKENLEIQLDLNKETLNTNETKQKIKDETIRKYETQITNLEEKINDKEQNEQKITEETQNKIEELIKSSNENIKKQEEKEIDDFNEKIEAFQDELDNLIELKEQVYKKAEARAQRKIYSNSILSFTIGFLLSFILNFIFKDDFKSIFWFSILIPPVILWIYFLTTYSSSFNQFKTDFANKEVDMLFSKKKIPKIEKKIEAYKNKLKEKTTNFTQKIEINGGVKGVVGNVNTNDFIQN